MGEPEGCFLNCLGRSTLILYKAERGQQYDCLWGSKSQEHRGSSEDGMWENPCPVTDDCIEASLGGERKKETFPPNYQCFVLHGRGLRLHPTSPSHPIPPSTPHTIFRTPQEDKNRLWGHSMPRNVHVVGPISSEDGLVSFLASPRTHMAQPWVTLLKSGLLWPPVDNSFFFLPFPDSGFPWSTHQLPWRQDLLVLLINTFLHLWHLVELGKCFHLNKWVMGGSPLSMNESQRKHCGFFTFSTH